MSEETGSNEEECPFHLFTPFSVNERRTNASQDGKSNIADSSLEDGRRLPQPLINRFPSTLTYKQLEEIDDFYRNASIPTFVVIDSCHEIHRYSADRSLYIFGPQNVVRRFAVAVDSHVGFLWFTYLTILTYMLGAMYPPNTTFEHLEAAMLMFWILEFFVKIIARGFVISLFSYFRNDFRNQLDFIAILSMIFSFFPFHYGRTISPLRGFRLIDPLRKGLRLDLIIVNILRNIRSAMVYFLTVVFVISLFGLQAFMGIFRSRCAKKSPFSLAGPDWNIWYGNPSNYIYGDFISPQMCSNYTLTEHCGSGDVICIPSVGDNPDYGLTNFDTLGWSLLASFRLLTLDFWDELYRMVYSLMGFKTELFFIPVIFIVAMFFISLFAAIVTHSFKTVYFETFSNTTQLGNGIRRDQDNGIAMEIPNNSVNEKLYAVFCKWSCVSMCPAFREKCRLILTNPIVELFFKSCILLNIGCLSIDHHDMQPGLYGVLATLLAFFNIVFVLEVISKILCLTPAEYFKDIWNRWDFILVLLYIFFASAQEIGPLHFFEFALFRIFKLINFLSYFNKLMLITTKSLRIFVRILFSFVIIVITFATLGLTAFGTLYIVNTSFFHHGLAPRWNYTDFIHSFMTVFRALCGEWIETMYDCIKIAGYSCIPFYIVLAIVGKFILVNLFLGAVLVAFETVGDEHVEEEPNDVKLIKSLVKKFPGIRKNNHYSYATDYKDAEINLVQDEEVDDTDGEDQQENEVQQMEPVLTLTPNSQAAETKFTQFVKGSYFNYSIIIIIIVSCVLLGFDDKYTHTRRSLHNLISLVNVIILLIFIFEMVFKWMAYGFKGYFSSKLNMLDFVINVLWLIEMFFEFAGHNVIPTLNTVRVLRIFRIIDVSTEESEMKLIINTFWKSLPGLANAVFVILVSWLVYAIIGVQLFAGLFHHCYDFRNDLMVNVSIVGSKNECLLKNYSWVNSEINFDHILNAYLALFQIATFKGHLHVIHAAIDGNSVSLQPVHETNLYSYFYFFYFTIFASLLSLNLFFGVIYTTFKEERQQLDMSRSGLFTRNDVYNNAMRKIRTLKPAKAIPPPQSQVLQKLYNLVRSELYEAIIVIFILVNVGILTYDNYYFTGKSYDIFWQINNCLLILFVIDCGLKLIAYRQFFFTKSWNLFDLMIVVLQLVELLVAHNYLNPALFRVFRVFKFAQTWLSNSYFTGINVISLIWAKTLELFYRAYFLLMTIICVYAMFGLHLFMHVKKRHGFDNTFNFDTFLNAFITLIPLSTTAGWSDVLSAIMDENNCETTTDMEQGDCGNHFVALIYVISFVFLTYFIVMNIAIATVFDSYKRVNEELKVGITDYTIKMFLNEWQRFDVNASEFIHSLRLNDFLKSLKEPFKVTNSDEVTAMNIKVSENDMYYYINVFDALVRRHETKSQITINTVVSNGNV